MGRGEKPFAPTKYDSQPISQPYKNRRSINWNDSMGNVNITSVQGVVEVSR